MSGTPDQKRFMNIYQRSQQLWPILVFAAMNRQTLTYTMVSKATGLYIRAVGKALYPIQFYCEQKGLPPITMLIVKKTEGIPESGLVANDFPKKLQEVIQHPWLKCHAPAADEFEKADRYEKQLNKR